MTCNQIDKFDYMIAMATINVTDNDAEYYQNLRDDNIEIDVKCDNRIKSMIRRFYVNNRVARHNYWTKIAVVALIVMSVTLASMLSISAVRKAIWETILDFHEKYFTLQYQPEIESPDNFPTKIVEKRKPQLMINGAIETIITDTPFSYAIDYYLNDECYMLYNQMIITEDNNINHEDVNIDAIVINGNEVIITQENGSNDMNLYWNDGAYSYVINAHGFSKDYIVDIICSIH